MSVALLELAPKCEALELTMHEVASKLADVLRMSVLDSSAAPAVPDLPPATQNSSVAPAEGDLPPATQRWSRLRVLLTAASAFTEAAAKRALCLICLEEVSTRRGLACPEGHLICSECLQGYICSLAGSARLRSSNGALGCLGAHLQPFSFGSNMVEPLLFGDALRLYLETTETTESNGDGGDAGPRRGAVYSRVDTARAPRGPEPQLPYLRGLLRPRSSWLHRDEVQQLRRGILLAVFSALWPQRAPSLPRGARWLLSVEIRRVPLASAAPMAPGRRGVAAHVWGPPPARAGGCLAPL